MSKDTFRKTGCRNSLVASVTGNVSQVEANGFNHILAISAVKRYNYIKAENQKRMADDKIIHLNAP